MLAVEIILDSGTFYIPLSTWDRGSVLIPMDDGHRVLMPDQVRGSWNSWVSDLIGDDDLLTLDELKAQYPGIEIDYEVA